MATNADDLPRGTTFAAAECNLGTPGQLRGCGDYRFHVRPVPVFIANACISATNRATRAQKGGKRRSESDRVRSRAGGKVIKLLLNFAIMQFMSKDFEHADARYRVIHEEIHDARCLLLL